MKKVAVWKNFIKVIKQMVCWHLYERGNTLCSNYNVYKCKKCGKQIEDFIAIEFWKLMKRVKKF